MENNINTNNHGPALAALILGIVMAENFGQRI